LGGSLRISGHVLRAKKCLPNSVEDIGNSVADFANTFRVSRHTVWDFGNSVADFANTFRVSRNTDSDFANTFRVSRHTFWVSRDTDSDFGNSVADFARYTMMFKILPGT
jgi:hypothetical protein